MFPWNGGHRVLLWSGGQCPYEVWGTVCSHARDCSGCPCIFGETWYFDSGSFNTFIFFKVKN